MADNFEIKRSMLYKEIWRTPITRYAQQHHISSQKLKEACDTNNIPTPDRNYWIKKNNNQSVTIPDLPDGKDVIISITRVVSKNIQHLSSLTSKAHTSCILRILELKTDINRFISTNDIISYMSSIYQLSIERRTVYSSIRILKQLGYNICEENNRYSLLLSNKDTFKDKGFEPDEVQHLLDSITLNPILPPETEKSLFYKTKRLMPKHNCSALHNAISEVDKKYIPPSFYNNVDQITEAITNCKKIEFNYMRYSPNGKLIKRYDESFVVSPVRFRFSESISYVLCDDLNGNRIRFRIDKISDLSVLDDDAHIKKHYNSSILNADNDMKSIDVIEIKIKCQNDLADFAVDYFGHKANFEICDSNHFILTATAVFEKAEMFALIHYDKCEIIEPTVLRDGVIAKIKNE